MESKTKIDELKEKGIGKLILQYALPSIIGMIVFALYLFIVQIFIARGIKLGVHAVGGIGICLPIMVLLTAISMLTGIGAATNISIYLGKDNKQMACSLLGNSITLSVIISLLFTLVFFLFFEPILRLIGATEENYPYVKDFLIIFIPFTVVFIVNGSLNYIIRASGYPKKSMLLLLANLVLNIITIYLFLFIMHWGIKGAAAAMVLCQIITFIPTLSHFLQKNNPVPLRIQSLKLNLSATKLICKIGISPFLVNSSTALVTFISNNRLTTYGGSFAIDSYTIANALLIFVILILSGLAQGIQPIIGYNYGAQKIDRVLKVFKITVIIGVIVGITGIAAIHLFSYPLASILSPHNKNVVLDAVRCIKILSIGLPLSGFQMTITSFFQSIGSAGKAFMLGITRQWVFLIPPLFIFPLFWQVQGVWYVVPFVDVLSSLLGAIVFVSQLRKLKTLFPESAVSLCSE